MSYSGDAAEQVVSPKNRVSASSLSNLAMSSRNKKDTRLTDAGRLTMM